MSLTLAGPMTAVWTHLAVVVCSYAPPHALLAVTPWQGVLTSSSTNSPDNFLPFDPATSLFQVGGTPIMQGQILDVRFDPYTAEQSTVWQLRGLIQDAFYNQPLNRESCYTDL